MVLSFLSFKGGSGKSSLALNLSSLLSTNKLKVLLLDADPQGAISRWADVSVRKQFVIGHTRLAIIHDNISHLQKTYNVIVIVSLNK